MLLRLKASVKPRDLDLLRPVDAEPDSGSRIKRTRRCFFGGSWVETPCYDGERLRAGDTFRGPAIVEEKTTTVLVPAGFTCEVDPARTYVLRRESVA